ncbi:DUF998 domain-containing protein [Mycobacterium montefiorense]|uniref:DUF998 domain-containing protein n=1 Tax=Mycobacterium montefiorense TaxID=154654 RepID=UPI0021DC022C|nr:DUF998 domain-containing protein [Mycobacterium montefiorense]MCV7429501.1 DUF998 domain-containing protein [Mycobacterium montefiorense]GLE52718.1 hypothetical protein ATCCBAA256_22820 [Mycobacterium montefiorense]
MATTRGAALWVVAAIGYLALEAVAAAGFEPGYSYAHNYISDLGVSRGKLIHGQMVYSPRAYLMHIAFYLQGMLFFLGASLMVGVPDNRRARIFLGTVAVNAVGNFVIGTIHSGRVHIVGAVLAIVAGNAAILTGITAIRVVAERPWYRRISKLLAGLGLLSMIMLMLNSATAKTIPLPDGAWERVSVYSITLWQLLTGACLLATRRRQAGRLGR